VLPRHSPRQTCRQAKDVARERQGRLSNGISWETD
jgi:hypothetical protein